MKKKSSLKSVESNHESWTVTIQCKLSGTERSFKNVVADNIMRDEVDGKFLPYRMLKLADGRLVEYPINDFITSFSAERSAFIDARQAQIEAEKQME